MIETVCGLVFTLSILTYVIIHSYLAFSHPEKLLDRAKAMKENFGGPEWMPDDILIVLGLTVYPFIALLLIFMSILILAGALR